MDTTSTAITPKHQSTRDIAEHVVRLLDQWADAKTWGSVSVEVRGGVPILLETAFTKRLADNSATGATRYGKPHTDR